MGEAMSETAPRNSVPPAASARAMSRSVRQLSGDVLSLMELQAELLQIDVRDWVQSFICPLVALAMAAIVALGTIPIALISLGFYLEASAELPLWAAMLAAAGAGLGLAIIVAGLGIWLLKRDRQILHRFSTELRKNVRWLREMLSHSPDPSTAD